MFGMLRNVEEHLYSCNIYIDILIGSYTHQNIQGDISTNHNYMTTQLSPHSTSEMIGIIGYCTVGDFWDCKIMLMASFLHGGQIMLSWVRWPGQNGEFLFFCAQKWAIKLQEINPHKICANRMGIWCDKRSTDSIILECFKPPTWTPGSYHR